MRNDISNDGGLLCPYAERASIDGFHPAFERVHSIAGRMVISQH
jgi:hypothetical protein